ncbi:MAG: tetratricopeptide repeat protein [Elainella sp. C42_A2020_010]|nr:tetratricopeptide repeat protein [Elainella sp. C42_A2020_010]
MNYLAEAYAAYSQGNLDEAYLLSQQATTAEPGSAEAYALWGKVCQTRLNYEEALKHYQKAAELETEKAVYRYQMANVFMLQGNYKQAEAFYRQVLDSEIDDPWLFCNLGKALLYQDSINEAADFLQRAVDLAPQLAEAHCCLGRVLTRQKRFAASELHYQKAIELESGQFIYYHDQGDNFLLQGNYQAAVAAYRKAIELNSSYVWSYRNLARALLQLEEWNNAATALEEAICLGSNSAETYIELGYAFSKQQKFDSAIATYQAAVEKHPNDAVLYCELGAAQEKVGDSTGCILSLRQAIELDPQQPVWVYETLLKLVHQQGNLDEAIAIGQQGVELYPQASLEQHLNRLQQEIQAKATSQSKNQELAINGDGKHPSQPKPTSATLSNDAPCTKIFIVTPTCNVVDTIDRTIASVVLQAGDFSIRYHVQDGGSTDGTIEVLERWAERIRTGAIPLLCKQIEFTYASAEDEGIYDALFKGFSSLSMQPNDWMTWINVDDILIPGACAFIAELDKQLDKKTVRWVTGTTFVASSNVPVATSEIPVNQEVIKHGLCDGRHWDSIQQEGTFFRNSLWRSVDTDKGFRRYKFAGDWNLWRLFAEKKANIFQVNFSLAQSSQDISEKSQDKISKYYLEVDKTVPEELRFQNLQAIDLYSLKRCLIKSSIDGKISLKKEPFDIYNKASLSKKSQFDFAIKSQHSKLLDAKLAAKRVTCNKTVIGFDSDWQFPAITEKQAFLKACEMLSETQGAVYFAFPWATLIDQLNTGVIKGNELKAILDSFQAELKNYQYVITVCQHILMLKYQHLFIDSGITHIYWSHAVKGQTTLPQNEHVQILPFPLFPVQVSEAEVKQVNQRKYLYSFIGARANQWYLTNARDLIIDNLSKDHRGLVVGRDNWHFQKVVYDHQIFQKQKSKQELVNTQATEEFKTVLSDSLFSLCPSGTGPNSIRLWESIGYGAIPVVLADTYQPPGNKSLWEEATVACGENLEEILALPNRLAEMAKDEQLIQRKQAALKQLWMLYGPDCFIHDIVNLFLELQQKQVTEARKVEQLAV